MGVFRPLTNRSVRWRPLEGIGLEHLRVASEDGRIVARGAAIGEFEGNAFGVRYKVICEPDWTFRELELDTANGVSLKIASDGRGGWIDGRGEELPGFEDCIDIDLGGSAFTNTLPIRRLNLEAADGPAELSMLYVPFNSFKPFVDDQRYTCLEPRRYRYEAVDGAFAGELVVDDDGLIVEFPPLFIRVGETLQ
jgi:hypothetical protein